MMGSWGQIKAAVKAEMEKMLIFKVKHRSIVSFILNVTINIKGLGEG